MGEDNLMKLSEFLALVSLYLEPKGRGIKNEGCHTLFTRIGDFSRKKGVATLIFTPRPCPFRFKFLGSLVIKVIKGSL